MNKDTQEVENVERISEPSLWNKIKCDFQLHSYKIIVKLKSGVTKSKIGGKIDILEVPFEAYEICKVCGKERNLITGAIQDNDEERTPKWPRKK